MIISKENVKEIRSGKNRIHAEWSDNGQKILWDTKKIIHNFTLCISKYIYIYINI
jgi:hypothetical protein